MALERERIPTLLPTPPRDAGLDREIVVVIVAWKADRRVASRGSRVALRLWPSRCGVRPATWLSPPGRPSGRSTEGAVRWQASRLSRREAFRIRGGGSQTAAPELRVAARLVPSSGSSGLREEEADEAKEEADEAEEAADEARCPG